MTVVFNVIHNNYASYVFRAPATTANYVIGLNYGLGKFPAGQPTIPLAIMRVILDDSGAVGGGPFTLNPMMISETRRVANSLATRLGLYDKLEVYADQSISPASLQNIGGDIRMRAGTLTGGICGASFGMRVYNVATVTENVYGVYITTYGGMDGTIGGNFNGLFIERQSGDALTSVTNDIGANIKWDVSGVTACTGYSAAISADVDADGKTFTVYGARMTFTGTIGGGATWRGYHLDATAVVCGAGETFYGLDLDLSTITAGGTINGIRCIVPNAIPAMVLGDGTGTLTIDFGTNSHPNIDSSTGRFYFGTQAGGSAGADDIYCHGVLQTAPWAENTWDSIDDMQVLREISAAVNEARRPELPEAFMDKYCKDGYYDQLQMDALERGAILKLAERVERLERLLGSGS